eukprot:m.88812 g.88812  ORF g.88812 m.88812 type:complete len:1299 (-) comp8385_c2_seq1:2953-6849(-)
MRSLWALGSAILSLCLLCEFSHLVAASPETAARAYSASLMSTKVREARLRSPRTIVPRSADGPVAACTVCNCTSHVGEVMLVDKIATVYLNITGIRVDCTGLGLTVVPVFPPGTALIHLEDNYLTTIPASAFHGLASLQGLNLNYANLAAINTTVTFEPGVFSAAGLGMLIFLSMGYNGILTESFHEDRPFANLPALQQLIFSYNNVTVVPPGWLDMRGSPAFSVLSFQQNHITTLTNTSFSLAPNLLYFDYSGNALTSLPDGIFANNPHLVGMLIYGNKITYVTPDAFPPTVIFLYMSDNPSSCFLGVTAQLTTDIICQCAKGYVGLRSCIPLANYIPYTPPSIVAHGIEYSFPFPEQPYISCPQGGGFCNPPHVNGIVTFPADCGYTPDPKHLYVCFMTSPTMMANNAMISFMQISAFFDSAVEVLSMEAQPALGFPTDIDLYPNPAKVAVPTSLTSLEISLDPPLDVPGLVLNPVTGIVSGTPLASQPPTHYAVILMDVLSTSRVRLGNLTLAVPDCIAATSCNGNGVCVDAVPYNGVYTCSCNPGFFKADCSGASVISSGSSQSTYIIVAVVLPVLALILIFAAIVYVCRGRRPVDWTETLAAVSRHNAAEATIAPKEIPRTRLTLLESLGAGNFGEVHKAVLLQPYHKNSIFVACKGLHDVSARAQFLEEAAIMAQFDHENVLHIVGVVSVGAPMLLISELAAHGDLCTFVGGHDCTDGQLLRFALDCCAGLEYIHARGYVHRDVAARNVLLSLDYRCKIADFGLSREVTGNYYLSANRQLAVRWGAPECLKDSKFSEASDVWSFGVLMHELWSHGRVPYLQLQLNDRVWDFVLGGGRLEQPACPDAVYLAMRTCWETEPTNRPTFTILRQFLSSLFEHLRYPRFDNDFRKAAVVPAVSGVPGYGKLADLRANKAPQSPYVGLQDLSTAIGERSGPFYDRYMELRSLGTPSQTPVPSSLSIEQAAVIAVSAGLDHDRIARISSDSTTRMAANSQPFDGVPPPSNHYVVLPSDGADRPSIEDADGPAISDPSSIASSPTDYARLDRQASDPAPRASVTSSSDSRYTALRDIQRAAAPHRPSQPPAPAQQPGQQPGVAAAQSGMGSPHTYATAANSAHDMHSLPSGLRRDYSTHEMHRAISQNSSRPDGAISGGLGPDSSPDDPTYEVIDGFHGPGVSSKIPRVSTTSEPIYDFASSEATSATGSRTSEYARRMRSKLADDRAKYFADKAPRGSVQGPDYDTGADWSDWQLDEYRRVHRKSITNLRDFSSFLDGAITSQKHQQEVARSRQASVYA